MIIITGGSGFIGSNLIRSLNENGYSDILVIDDLADGQKLRNLFSAKISDILPHSMTDDILKKITGKNIECIFHLGACSDTTEWNGEYILNNNYQYSKNLLEFALKERVSFIFASSASVYGLITIRKYLQIMKT